MKKPLILLAGLTATLMFTGCRHMPADMETGKRAYQNEDYQTALNHYQQLADFGIPEAKTELGKLYLYGRGTKKDPKMALALFEAAEKAGDSRTAPRYIPGAKAKVGAMALDQEPGAPPPAEGLELLREAAQKNEPSAWFELGQAFEKGIGVEQNAKLADEHYARAGELGYGRADYYRAQLHEKGDDLPRNISLAVDLYEKAGRNDYPRAWVQLGKIYEEGEGIPQDLKKASDYYTLAEAEGMDVQKDKKRLAEKTQRPFLIISDLLMDIEI